MASTDPASQVAYCGLYCNACGIRQEKIKTAVNNLRGIIAAYGFDKMMPELAKMEPSFRHYKEFDQVMDGLVKTFDGCRGCFQGGGDPDCIARSCAKHQGLQIPFGLVLYRSSWAVSVEVFPEGGMNGG